MDWFQKCAYRFWVCRSDKSDNVDGDFSHEALVYATLELFIDSIGTIGAGNVWNSEAMRDHVVGILP